MNTLEPEWTEWDASRLEAEVAAANRAYWDEDSPSISDYDYDRLVEALRAVAPNSPALQSMGPSTGARAGNSITHAAQMLSLDKAYDETTLHKWAAKFEGELVMTPKIDGVACSIRYAADGHLIVAATRGSGTVGEDITGNVLRIADVPDRIQTDVPVEVRGEVYLPISAFKKLSGDFANPRNTAAGALKQKNADKSARVGLRFFCYDVLGPHAQTEIEKFAVAKSWGFTPVEHELLSRDAVQAGYESYVARRAQLDFEIDGVVYKANRLDEQQRLGATSHHPRYAIAYKLQGESAPTVLREVEWSVSRTGVLTPVGIVDPVVLSGATVTRISLHNWAQVQAKKLSINAQVVAMRRGGVIPYLEALIEPGDTPIVPPERCPSCAAPAQVEGDLVVCTNPTGCGGRAVGALEHFAKAADIEGFGQVWLETFVDAGLLQSPVDFYRLSVDDLVVFERMGLTLAQKLVDRVAAARRLPLATFLRALGIPDLGKSASKLLAERYLNLEAVRNATVEELIELPKVAEVLANKIVDGLAGSVSLIEGLLEHIQVIDAEAAPEPMTGGAFEGKSFLFTGTLVGMKRAEAQKAVVALGGKSASGVSKSLSYLVIGNAGKAGSKLQKAEKAGVEVLSEDRFLELLAAAQS